MASTIQIHTRLHEDIYRSDDGGEDVTHHEWAAGPRNLMAAVDLIPEHRRTRELGYGNIGCGGSWVQVGDVRLSDTDEIDLRRESEPGDTRTARARQYITDIESGEIERERRAYAEAVRNDERLAETLHGRWGVDALRDAARTLRDGSCGLLDTYRICRDALSACSRARAAGAVEIVVDHYGAYVIGEEG